MSTDPRVEYLNTPCLCVSTFCQASPCIVSRLFIDCVRTYLSTCLSSSRTICYCPCRLTSTGRVPRGLVVKCMTRNPGVLGSSRTGSSGFFRGSVLGQDTSKPSLVLVKPRKDMNNVSCRRDMTEILLKAA